MFLWTPIPNLQSCHTGFGGTFSISELGLCQVPLSEGKAALGSKGVQVEMEGLFLSAVTPWLA